MEKLIRLTLIILVIVSCTTPVQAAETTQTASQILIDKATTTEDGLKKDQYEEGRYIFQGENVNNYLTFNNETAGWRIISVESDGSLKIIRTDSIGEMVFDSENARNNAEGGTYCYSPTAREYYGCNAWAATENLVGKPSKFTNGNLSGTVLKDAQINTELNTTYYNSLSEDAKKYIIDHNFSLGPTDLENDLETSIQDENKYIWNGKIGLINYTDTLRIMDWLHPGKEELLTIINPFYNGTSNNLFLTYYLDELDFTKYNPELSSGYTTFTGKIHPVVYITGDIPLVGDGTKENPYRISTTIKINFEVLGDIQLTKIDSEYLELGSTLEILKRQEYRNGNQLCTIEDWYLDQDLTTKLDAQTPLNNDLTLYSKWNCREVITVPNTSITIPVWVIYLGLGLIITGSIIIFIIIKKKNKKIEG